MSDATDEERLEVLQRIDVLGLLGRALASVNNVTFSVETSDRVSRLAEELENDRYLPKEFAKLAAEGAIAIHDSPPALKLIRRTKWIERLRERRAGLLAPKTLADLGATFAAASYGGGGFTEYMAMQVPDTTEANNDDLEGFKNRVAKLEQEHGQLRESLSVPVKVSSERELRLDLARCFDKAAVAAARAEQSFAMASIGKDHGELLSSVKRIERLEDTLAEVCEDGGWSAKELDRVHDRVKLNGEKLGALNNLLASQEAAAGKLQVKADNASRDRAVLHHSISELRKQVVDLQAEDNALDRVELEDLKARVVTISAYLDEQSTVVLRAAARADRATKGTPLWLRVVFWLLVLNAVVVNVYLVAQGVQ